MKNMKIFKYIFLSLIVASEGVIKFHENLSEDHLTHYFGTKSIHDVPAYEFTNPTEVTSRTSPNNHAPQYAIRAFNTDYHISLQKNQHLISPGCLVLKQQKNGTNEVSACSQGEHHDCYYHGHVVNHANSSVAVSTCTGLHGIIHMVDHDLVLQPIRREHVNHVQRSVNEALPHIVYKRQPATSATCGKSEPVFVPIPSKRRKRATGDKHYMQLRIVMAPDSTHFHGDDAKRYALTALNIAALRFKDPSLGHEILTAVIEILLLQGDQPELSLVDDSEQLLNSFCFWDEKRQPRSKEDDHFADGAMLITKMNLKYKNDPTNLGLGHVGGMCKANYRCSVNEDNGLDLGLTIAHETGHMLGMVHDGENNNCTTGINIMSGKGGSGLASTQWSRCSKAYLDTFLSSSVSNCLNDVPIPWEFQLMNSASKPGIIYSGNEQCRMAMDDPNSKLCEGTQLTSGNECKMLVCYGPVVPNHAQSCYRGGPVRLDGTECGHRNWCIGGECVAMGPDAPAAINGGWSAWDSDWTPCSRSCGGGVHVKTRKCNNPEPRFGGSTCPGSTIQAKLCNIESCPVHSKYRAEQCTATNAIPLQEKQYNWIPYNDDLCSLRCYDEYASIVDYRGDKYVDGTECQAPGPFSRCVAGKCRKFGCDGHLDSVRVFDKCGVCGGQSTTCTPHRGTYNQGRAKAYVTVITIPRGSTGVVVTNANKYCHMSVKIAGSLLFSQGTSISLSGKYVSNGVAVQYRRSSPERITIAGPTPVVLKLQVWRDYGDEYEDVKPQISYIYYTPIQQPYSDYTWRTTQGTCSQTCGTGHAIVNVQCVHKSTNTAVEDYHCDIYSQPRENVQQCNTKACPPEWNSEKWTSCSKSCGRGKQSRLVHCVIIQRDSHVITNDNQCSPAHKPAVSRRCNTQPCPGSWTPGAWSTCSLTCGRGSQTRTVNCYDAERSTVIVNDIRCDPHEKPIGHQHCILKPCNLAIVDGACKDRVECSRYVDTICEASDYRSWVTENCMEFCGICAKDPTVYTCKDTLTDCGHYEAGFCQKYQDWAKVNCPHTCGLCQATAPPTTPPTTRTTTEVLGHTANLCIDVVDCASYAHDICVLSRYRPWAKRNCNKHCGWCTLSSAPPTTPPTTHTTTEVLGHTANLCIDVVDCASYAHDICVLSRYRPWAKQHCNKHCGWCTLSSATAPPTTPPTTRTTTEVLGHAANVCIDVVDCASYAHDICVLSKYRPWAKQHCNKHCGWCSSGSHSTVATTAKPSDNSATCSDQTDCSSYQGDICTNTAYNAWAKSNCPKFCKLCSGSGSHSAVATTAKPSDNSAGCSDQMDCSSYQGDICTNTAYNEWAKSNCAKFCKLCSGSGGTEAGHTQTTAHPSSRCSDKLADCHSYQADTCTNSDFQSWARQNCAKHCGLCKVCSDKLSDCPGYGKDMCTNPSYQSWAFSNCASFCGLCDQVRRKRSISKLATTLKHALVPSRLPQPIVPPMEPGNLVPEFLSPEHSLRVPKPGKPLQQIFPEQQFEVEDVVPTPRKEVMEPVAILQIPKIVTDIQRVIQKNSQALVFPATGSQLVPNQNVAADIPVVVEQVPMVTSDQADLPPIEPGQIFVSVPAPKINLDQVPPRKTSEVKDDDVSVSDQHEMGSKVEDQQEMGSKVEDQQEMGSKVEDQHEVGSKIEGQQEMRLKEEDQQKMGSKIEGQQEMGSKVEDQQEMGSKEEDQQKMGSKIEGQQEMGSKIEGQQEMGSKIEGQQEMGSKEEDQQKMGSKVEDQQKMGSKVEDQQVLSEVEDQQEVGLKVEGRQEVGSEGEDQQNMGSKDQNQQKTRSKVEDYIETTVADQEEAYKGDSGERDGQKLVHELDALKQ